MMYRTLLILSVAAVALCAEIPVKYDETHNIQNNDGKVESETHPLYKKSMEHHPVYRPENEGRARIAPVRPIEPVVRHDNMLSDQPGLQTSEVNRVDHTGVQSYGFVPAPAEVAYPDVPYAPGYGYDNTYSPSNQYDAYGNNFGNYLMEPDTSAFGLLWSQVPDARTLVSFAGRTIVWVLNSVFVLLIGSIVTVGLCSYTNLCSITFNGVGPIHEEMRSLMTSDRLEKISTAADFVKTAINKYQDIQKTDEMNRKRRAMYN